MRADDGTGARPARDGQDGGGGRTAIPPSAAGRWPVPGTRREVLVAGPGLRRAG